MSNETKCLDGQKGCDGGETCKALMRKRKELKDRGIIVEPYRGK